MTEHLGLHLNSLAMRYLRYIFVTLGLLFITETTHAANGEGRIYGTVTTQDGEVFEGIIRWDQNEVGWLDILDGLKYIEYETNDRDVREEIRVLGMRFRINPNRFVSDTKESGIRFGHIQSLESLNHNSVLLTLRDGRQFEMRSTSTDIGQSIRDIIVEDQRNGIIELGWADIDRIDFSAAPANLSSRFGELLYGTLTTRRGQSFSGYICWDIDEALTGDILDGEDRNERNREIPFGTITEIERFSSRSARVVLTNGEELVLRGTNDVNSSNRDILVLDPTLGQIRVSWDEFDRIMFEEPKTTVDYFDFQTGGLLKGTVLTRDEESFSGDICWDNDESYSWELLDGNEGKLNYKIEFGFIQSIERLSSRGAVVTLRDGRSFELHESNDVDDENDGIYIIQDDGSEVAIDWYNFQRVDFDKP